MKVSLICGVYNAEEHLDKCIRSMLNQTYTDIEIILVVNASQDASEQIVRTYSKEHPCIRAFYVDEKLGAGGSRQYGLERSTGDWVCFVDCDDKLNHNYVLELMKTAKKYNTVPTDIVICNFSKFDLDGNQIYKRVFKNKKEAFIQSIAPWGKAFRRDFFISNHLKLRNIPFGEDVLFSIEVYLLNPQVELTSYLGYDWLDNPSSTSHTELRGFPAGAVEKATAWFDDLTERFPDKCRELSYFRLKYFVWYLLQSGRRIDKAIMLNEYKKVFSYLYEADPYWNRYKKKPLICLSGERLVVKVALIFIRLLEKIHLTKWFFSIYSQSFLGNFWPSL